MNKKTLLFIVIAIIIVIIIVLVFKYRDVLFGVSASPVQLPSPGLPSKSSNDNFPLKLGSRGPNVKILQQSLNNLSLTLGFTRLTEDGVFGSKTQDAVNKALSKKEVTQDDFNTYILPFLNGAPSSLSNTPTVQVDDGLTDRQRVWNSLLGSLFGF